MNWLNFTQREGFDNAKALSKWAKWLMLSGYIALVLVKLFAEYEVVKQYYDHFLFWYFILVLIVTLLETASFGFSFRTRLTKIKNLTLEAFRPEQTAKDIAGYYDNQDETNCYRRAALNTYESCFFSMNIAQKMLSKIILKTAGWIIAMIVLIFYLNSHFAAMILSMTYPLTVIGKNLKFIYSVHILKQLNDDFHNFFVRKIKRCKPEDSAAVLTAMIQYEVTMSSLGMELSGDVYKELNETLTKEWKEMSTQYKLA